MNAIRRSPRKVGRVILVTDPSDAASEPLMSGNDDGRD